MSLNIALNPELEAKLLAEAKRRGQSLDIFLQQLLSQALAVSEPDAWLGEDGLGPDLCGFLPRVVKNSNSWQQRLVAF